MAQIGADGGPLAELGLRPVVVAPMAGGVSTPGLVTAAAQASALGFIAAGYKSAAAMREQIEAVEAVTSAVFGVNVFVPGRAGADDGALTAYLDALVRTRPGSMRRSVIRPGMTTTGRRRSSIW